MRLLFLLLLLSSVYAQLASAQTLDSLRVGARVRVWAVAEGLDGRIGEVTSFESERLLLRLAGVDTAYSSMRDVPLVAIDRIDVSRGRVPASGPAAVGGLLGLLGGVGLAALVVSSCPSDGLSCYVAQFGAPPLGLVFGAIAGASGRPYVWETIPVRR